MSAPKYRKMKLNAPLDAPESGLSNERRIKVVRQTLDRKTAMQITAFDTLLVNFSENQNETVRVKCVRISDRTSKK